MSSDHRVYSYSAVLMGSPILLKLFSHDEALASRVFRLIKQYEDLLTVNRASSQVMDINHAAGQHPVTVSRPVFELIRCAKAASQLKDSAFNLAIGPLVKRWKIGFREIAFRLPMKSRRCSPLPILRMCSLMRPAAACS